jgi:hypothetical protein
VLGGGGFKPLDRGGSAALTAGGFLQRESALAARMWVVALAHVRCESGAWALIIERGAS